MQAFIYMDNQAKAMKRCGEIWLDMAKEIYIDEGREMKTISQHGDRSTVKLMTPTIDKDGAQTYENNLGDADCDVVVDVGPSFASKRSSTVRSLTNLLSIIAPVDPNQASLISSAIMMNIEGEGLSDIKDFYHKKLVGMGVIKPTEEEQAEMEQSAQQQQPDANTVYLQSAAKNEEAKAMKAAADTQNVNAKTASIIKDMNHQDREHTLNVIKTIADITKPTIGH
jgi:hypothetical protein